MSDLGTISLCYSVTFDRRLRHSPDRLWRAITDAKEVARWMGYRTRIDLKIGGAYFVDFEGTGEGGLDGVITRIKSERVLWFSWGQSMICWELDADGDGSRYRFVHHGQEPRDIPDEEGLAAGWHAWLEDLESYLEGGERTDESGSPRRTDLKQQYRPLLAKALGDALVPGL